METGTGVASEAQIEAMVRRFYDLCDADAELGPMFRAAIPDWEGHLKIIMDFWSSTLLGTKRYEGNPFMAHAGLPIEPRHFATWLFLFERAVGETLPPASAEMAIGRARRMAKSISVGLFTVPGHKFTKPA